MNTEITMVGEITEEHYGWIIAIDDPSLLTKQRDIYLIKHCKLGDQKKVGLVDKDFSGKYVGKEYHYNVSTPCRILRQWCDRKKLSRRSK